MIGSILQTDLEEIIKEKNWDALREAFAEMPLADIAEVLIDLPVEDEGVIFRVLPRTQAAEVFSYLPLDRQEELVRSLSDEQVHSILDAMTPDDRTRLLEELPDAVTRHLLATLSPAELVRARQLLGYPERTCGRYMTPDYVALRPDMTAREALEHVRTTGRGKETLAILYIVDENGKLLEDLRLGSLVLADPDVKVSRIEDRALVTVPATATGEEVIAEFEKYDRVALPVVDSQGHMLGIITHDDVLEFAEKRATAEIHQLGGSEALEQPYLEVKFWSMVKKRGGWLAILFLGEMLTATAMGYFEGQIERAAVIALFVPLIISSGGNSGSQGTSLIIRSLALKELKIKDWWRVFGRELRTGLALGIFLGVIGFARIATWQGLSHVPAVGGFFQTHGSKDQYHLPDNLKMVVGDTQLTDDVKIPAFTMARDTAISKGMVVPVETQLPADVPTITRSYDTPTAYGQHWALIGLTVFCALIGVVAWGSLAGSMLPFVLRSLGFDPATSSAPFVATLVDVTGLIIYFVVAKIILTGTLL